MYVAVWQAAGSVADLLQVALITHALGLEEFGRLALAMSVVMIAGQLLDVRAGATVTTFGARWLQRDKPRAVGVVQFTFLVDVGTGLLAFLLVLALNPFVTPALVDDGATAIVALYALSLLVSTADDSSLSVLRLLGRFRFVAFSSIGLEALRLGLVALALAVEGTLVGVVLAIVAAQLVRGVVFAVAGVRALKGEVPGVSVRRPAIAGLGGERREMVRMMVHTNTLSYVRLAQLQFPTLIIGAITGAREVGVYKVGMAVAAFVGRLADPAYAAILPRLARLWSAGNRDAVRRLALRCTQIAAPALLAMLLVVVALRFEILDLFGDPDAREAAGVVIAGALAHTINGSLFWNLGLLYAVGDSGFVAVAAIVSALVQVAATVPLVMWIGAEGAALAFLASMVTINLMLTPRALRWLRRPSEPGT